MRTHLHSNLPAGTRTHLDYLAPEDARACSNVPSSGGAHGFAVGTRPPLDPKDDRSIPDAGFRLPETLHFMGESMANAGKPSKTFLARIHSIDVIFAATLVTHSPCFDCRSGGT
jgi:hypothetical protein